MGNSENLTTYGTQDRKTKQKHNTICIGHHYAQANTNNVNKIKRYVFIWSVSSFGASFEHDVLDNILHMYVITF
jgi:hypothetical protein